MLGTHPLAVMVLRSLLLSASLVLIGCTTPDESASPAPMPLERPSVDAAFTNGTVDVTTWPYQQRHTHDLNGDGTDETLVLTAEVEVNESGEPLWEDGHRWAIYVDEANASPTFLYGGFVPNGDVELGLTDSTSPPNVLVNIRTPYAITLHEVHYLATGDAQLITYANFPVRQWLSP
ncbi:MAG: hypothetical protein RhofKO_13380 [Rhodothermales bacterium]